MNLIINKEVEEYSNSVSKTPLVSVCVQTYQHVNYIKECLESILLQKTSFEFEILLGDDASNDGTRETCIEYAKKHPNRIRLFLHHRENNIKINGSPTGRFNFLYNLYSSKGKYIALCEGDDYWTDPNKLQKQVDFLEANPEYGLIHTEFDQFFENEKKYKKNYWKNTLYTNQSGDIYCSLMVGKSSMIATCTACFRASFVKQDRFNGLFKQGFMMGDYPLWLYIASQSKIGYLNESTACRNVLSYSVTHGRNFDYHLKFIESGKDVFDYFYNIKPVSEIDKNSYLQLYYRNILNLCYRMEQRKDLFNSYYKLLNKENKDLTLKIKHLGMQNRFLFKITTLVFKLLNRLR